MNPWRRLGEFDALIAGGALLVMLLVPLLEIVLRPLFGSGIDNAPVLVQHCGLLLAMFGALLAERGLHLSALGAGFTASANPLVRNSAVVFGKASAAVLCGMLAQASWTFVATEMEMPRDIAYGIAGWMFEIAMPLGFALLGLKLASRITPNLAGRIVLALALPAAGYVFAQHFDGSTLPVWPFALWLTLILFCGAPIFAVLGGLALALFWSEGQPLASVPLSHYQITVNPSLPALPLFTLAGLLFARTGAAARLGEVFTAAFGSGVAGTAIAAAVLCSFFTAFTGGSGVTILALGGLLLPLLTKAGFPEQRGISLVTSASALGVLLAPSVPLIMYAIIARVPINTMFLAGVLPAVLMVACLLLVGGYLRRGGIATVNREKEPKSKSLGSALWVAKWELLAPVVAIGSLVSGIATPTESAALTAMYALLTQSIAHRELDWPHFRTTLGARPDQLPRRCRHSRPGHRLGAVGAAQQVRLPHCPQSVPATGRGLDGNLRGHRRPRPAAPARSHRLRRRSGALWRDFPGQYRDGLSLPAGRYEHLFRLGDVRQADPLRCCCRIAGGVRHVHRRADHFGLALAGDMVAKNGRFLRLTV
ncbi:MAG: TRAP C4-dicarboxylate transport system permease DctM subunit [Rhodocyclaceae bacterium]|nr:MAG: TRAP C4-dicarboxylate transport system permease DctM subunit [Rhodocyclaceae bacterium]